MEKAVYSAVLTPFNNDLSIDKKLFISHCEFLLKNNMLYIINIFINFVGINQHYNEI